MNYQLFVHQDLFPGNLPRKLHQECLMILETSLSFLTKSAVQCRVEGLPQKLDQEWLIILESLSFQTKSAGHCRLVSISQYWDCPLFSYWDPTGAWADKSNGVPTLDASYNCMYVEKYVRKIRARTLFTCRSKMFPCNSQRGRRKKGRERGREKSTKEGKGKGVPSPLSPSYLLPFSLSPTPFDACYAGYPVKAIAYWKHTTCNSEIQFTGASPSLIDWI